MSDAADPAGISRALGLLCQPGAVYELRVLNTRKGTCRGYYNDLAKLGHAAAAASGKAPAVYITLNPVLPDLLARAANRVAPYARETAADGDILTQRWLPIDFDVVRPPGISSTDAEHEAALARAREARAWLTAKGWPTPILADSGNGAHLLYRVDLPNDAAATNLLRDCLQALAVVFDDRALQVDTGNFNAARVWKLYGTLVCKGDNVPERPHRLAKLLEVPDLLEVVPIPWLESLAAQAPKQPPRSQHYRGRGEPFDLGQWIAEHDIGVLYEGSWNGGRKWVLEQCVWDPNHADKSAYIVQFASGQIAAGCHHNSCQGKGWHDLREAIEPGYRDRPRQPQQARKVRGHIYLPRVEVSK